MNYWKSVYSSDLEATLRSCVSAGSLLQLMIPSHMSEKLSIWWNLCLFSFVFLIGFLSGCYFRYRLLHGLCMVWSFVTRSFSWVRTSKTDSRFCLLLRARVAIGIKRVERMAYCELLKLHNSHAPLLYLEAARRHSHTNQLCRIMKDAYLSHLSDLNNASDIISRHVERVLLQQSKYVRQQQLWERLSCQFNRRYFDDLTIEKFKLLLLVLSLFETTDKDIKTVILYGVPGLPSISLSVTATYTAIRAIIAQRARNLRNFYFVACDRIIQIEDTVIN